MKKNFTVEVILALTILVGCNGEDSKAEAEATVPVGQTSESAAPTAAGQAVVTTQEVTAPVNPIKRTVKIVREERAALLKEIAALRAESKTSSQKAKQIQSEMEVAKTGKDDAKLKELTDARRALVSERKAIVTELKTKSAAATQLNEELAALRKVAAEKKAASAAK